MISFLILSMSVFVTSIIAHLRIRSYLIASITALLLGPLMGCFVYFIASGLDSEVGMWLPVMVIYTSVLFSPAPFVLGLGVRLGKRLYRKSHGSCIKCGHKMNSDITLPCPQCGWQQERIRKGLCPLCTYDLRSEFTSGCPECGWRRVQMPADLNLTNG